MQRIILALLLVSPAWGATYCVKAGGTTPAGCTSAYTTIALAKAAVIAVEGHTDFVATETILVYDSDTPYAPIGDTYAPSWPNKLAPTATHPLIIQAAPGNSPVIDCGGRGGTTDVITLSSPYITLSGFELQNCRYAVNLGAGATYSTVDHNKIHDMGGYAALYGTPDHLSAHHNTIYSVLRGIVLGGYSEVSFNEISASTAGNLITSGTVGNNRIHDNILYNAYAANGSGVQTGQSDVVYDNVSYTNRYGIQSQIITAPGPIFQRNIAVNNAYSCHCEGGSNPCFVTMDRNFCYRSTLGQALRENSGSSTPGAVWTNNIAWGNSVNSLDKPIFVSALVQILYSNRNVFVKTGTMNTALQGTGNVQYATLTAWQATGFDADSIEGQNPRLVGDPNLLVTTAQICPSPACTTIEQRLAFIRRNYAPTNLALKGRASDGSDPGPVPITIYNAPGITGGGVY